MNKITQVMDQIPWLMKAVVADAFIVLLAVIFGKLLSYLASEKMKELRINDYFRFGLEPQDKAESSTIGASDFIAFFFTVTVWMLGLVGILLFHEQTTGATYLIELLKDGGKVAFAALFTILGAAAASQGITALIRSPFIRSRLETMAGSSDHRSEPFSESLARGLGMMVASAALLLVFLTFAEVFGLSGAKATLSALWNLGLRLFSAAAAFCVGGLGFLFLRHAREDAESDQEKDPRSPSLDLRARIGLILVTTIFALDLIASAFGAMFWVILILLIALFLVPLKERLFNVWAGFALEFYQVKIVPLKGEKLTIQNVGILFSEVAYPDGRKDHLPNHLLLGAYQQTVSQNSEAY